MTGAPLLSRFFRGAWARRVSPFCSATGPDGIRWMPPATAPSLGECIERLKETRDGDESERRATTLLLARRILRTRRRERRALRVLGRRHRLHERRQPCAWDDFQQPRRRTRNQSARRPV